MVNIDYIMDLLDWNNNSEDQLLGIKLARDVKCINAFLQPGFPYGKRVWDNCAKILSERTDEELSPYFVELLEWLQDLNWPGTFIIINRLIRFNGDSLLETYSKVVYTALRNEEENNEWLGHLSKLLENHHLSKGLNRNLHNIMLERYNSFWR